MTEVPEHLLRRSRERREALGLAGPGEGESGGAAESGGASAPAPAAIPADTGDGGDVVEQPAAAAAPAVVEPEPELVPAGPPPPDPGRSKNPLWVMPVLVSLPLWLFIYANTLVKPSEGAESPLTKGKTLFNLPDAFTNVATTTFAGLPMTVWIAAGLFVVAGWVLRYHRWQAL